MRGNVVVKFDLWAATYFDAICLASKPVRLLSPRLDDFICT